MMTPALTGDYGYFEDFVVGEVTEHARAKTVTEVDNILLTHMVMNTAQGHFNEQMMAKTDFGQRLVFGGITASIVMGLSSQDTTENLVEELGFSSIRFTSPVFHGDTVTAFTEVLASEDRDATSGIVTFHHWGVNQRDQIVFEGTRLVAVKRRKRSGS
jgi:itaconyl-CoA hydratase